MDPATRHGALRRIATARASSQRARTAVRPAGRQALASGSVARGRAATGLIRRHHEPHEPTERVGLVKGAGRIPGPRRQEC